MEAPGHRISHRFATFFQKRLLPVLLLGFFAFAMVGMAVGTPRSHRLALLPVLLLLAAMAGWALFVVKKLFLILVDDVRDAGGELVVRNGGREEHVPLTDIMNVSCEVTNPGRVTLMLRRAGPLGKEISFIAPIGWIPFSRSQVVDDLIQRIDAARGGR